MTQPGRAGVSATGSVGEVISPHLSHGLPPEFQSRWGCNSTKTFCVITGHSSVGLDLFALTRVSGGVVTPSLGGKTESCILMSRRPARFTQADISRAIRAIQASGAPMAVEIVPDGTIRIIPANAASAPPEAVPCPREIKL
jgi:hypothetical protein